MRGKNTENVYATIYNITKKYNNKTKIREWEEVVKAYYTSDFRKVVDVKYLEKKQRETTEVTNEKEKEVAYVDIASGGKYLVCFG